MYTYYIYLYVSILYINIFPTEVPQINPFKLSLIIALQGIIRAQLSLTTNKTLKSCLFIIWSVNTCDATDWPDGITNIRRNWNNLLWNCRSPLDARCEVSKRICQKLGWCCIIQGPASTVSMGHFGKNQFDVASLAGKM